MRFMNWLVLISLVLQPVAFTADAEQDSDKLVVHEWGTFTTLQDEDGRELGAINIDDEPVPSFVHNLSRFILNPTFLTNYWRGRMKGLPRRHPHVTMRLETPVIYFYLPEGRTKPLTLDVAVRFLGGWLTEFYPDAKAEAPGIKNQFQFGDLLRSTVSSLTWSGLKVGTDGRGPETDEHVWTTPRIGDADTVTTPKGESEKYLFYRGVANQRSPLRVVSNQHSGRSFIRANFGEVNLKDETRVREAWLVDIDSNGRLAYRTIPSFEVTSDEEKVAVSVDGRFEASDYSTANLTKVKKEMHRALCDDGLYEAEATAMLETWNRAYFKSAGRRLFFVVPRPWTDHYLPLEVSKADVVERVMIGRVELVTPEHRRVLNDLGNAAVASAAWVEKIPKSPARDKFLAGRIDFGELGVEIPEEYRKYLELGRFRTALVLDHERRYPTKSLTAFVNAYGLYPYRWKDQRVAGK